MELKHLTKDKIHVLVLSGRFDAYEVPAVKKWFEEHPSITDMIVNLEGVTFIDSSGIAMLVKGLKQCRQNDGELYITNLQQAVRIIFELTRLDKAFRIMDEEQEAMTAIKGKRA
jgi:anti-sigma B factor antagonist